MLKSLWKLKPYLRPFYGLISISIVLAIPLSVLRFSPAPLVKYLVDELLVNRNSNKLLFFPALVLGMYLLNFAIRFGHYYVLQIVIARINQKLRNDLFNHLLGLSADYFTDQRTGTLISRVASDPQHVDGGISCLNILIREPITFLFLFGYAFYISWPLTLITLAIFPFLAWVFSAGGKNLKRYMTRMVEENANIFSTLQEGFTGIRIVKIFALEKYVRKQFRDRINEYTRFLLKTAALQEASHPMVELITAFAIAAVIYYGGSQVLQNKMTSGDLLAFFAAFALMVDPIRKLNDVNMKLYQAAAAADRIFEIFNWKSNLYEPSKPIRINELKKDIRFENVCFAYPDSPQRQILKNVSFTVSRGKNVALVGTSGSGKTSIANLLARIFDVTDGCIKLDGHDIRKLSIIDLRKMIAVVSQDVFLFNDTIEENIRCGRFTATKEEISEAAKQAYAMDFIQTLPHGFKTIIGDRGQKLSGGERQRISIARAFLRESPILILDEATSNLDTASERIVQQAISGLMQNRTTLIIAHRLSTIQNVNSIFVLKNGRIVESGSHDELLKIGGEYADFQQYNLRK